jgi:hypothetical protein
MEPDLGYGYIKMCKKRRKTHVSYRTKMGKHSKTYEDHNFLLKAYILENE